MYGLISGYICNQWVKLQQKHLTAISAEYEFDKGVSEKMGCRADSIPMVTQLKFVNPVDNNKGVMFQLSSELQAWIELSKDWINENIRQKEMEDCRVIFTMDQYFRKPR
jgi:hypothetical protein